MATETIEHQDYRERIDVVQQYIHRHVNEPLNRAVLADVAGFSVPHLHRVFSDTVGESIGSYVRFQYSTCQPK